MNRNTHIAAASGLAVLLAVGSSLAPVYAKTLHGDEFYNVPPKGELLLNKMPTKAETQAMCVNEAKYRKISAAKRESFIRTCVDTR